MYCFLGEHRAKTMTQVSMLLNDCVLYFNVYFSHRGFPGGNGNVVMSLPAYAEDLRDAGSTPGLRRSPGKGHSNPLQYSCLENPLDRGAWQASPQGLKELNMTEVTWQQQQIFIDDGEGKKISL